MKSKAKPPTKAERERMARLKEMPCVACEATQSFLPYAPIEVHHLLSGNKRRGHTFTIPLCSWHHRGDDMGWGSKDMTQVHGPSLALSSKAFRATFGTDNELLERTNKLLEKHDELVT